MQRYLELPVHGDKENAMLVDACDRPCQGGLEIPCTYTVEGPLRFVERVRELIR